MGRRIGRRQRSDSRRPRRRRRRRALRGASTTSRFQAAANRCPRSSADRCRSASTASPSSSRRYEAGTVRALAISSAERLPGLDVPTLREQGVDSSSRTGDPSSLRPASARASVSVSSRSLRPWWSRRNGEKRWRAIAGSIGICPVSEFAQFVDGEETRVRTTLQQLDTGQGSGGTLASVGAYPPFVLTGLAYLRDRCARGRARCRRRCDRASSTHQDLGHGVVDRARAGRQPRDGRDRRVRHRIDGHVLADGQSIRRSTSHSRRRVRRGHGCRRLPVVRSPPSAPLAGRPAGSGAGS